MRAIVRTCLVTLCAIGCAATPVREVENRRGQVNGESFELITDSEERGEWNIRIRGNAMWVAHTDGEETEELGKLKLEDDELEEIWELVGELDFPETKSSDVGPDDAMVLYRHRVPDEATYTATLPRKRATADKKLVALVKLLQRIIEDRTGDEARL